MTTISEIYSLLTQLGIEIGFVVPLIMLLAVTGKILQPKHDHR